MNNSLFEFIVEGPLAEVTDLADRARRGCKGTAIETCAIVNAKCGVCSEDCAFCAQSSHYSASINTYSLRPVQALVDEAFRAMEDGASRFSIVTSGDSIGKDELLSVSKAIHDIRKRTGLLPCASLGSLGKDEIALLKDSGLQRYHHNIETSSRYYGNIVSTHSFVRRTSTLEAVKESGLEICSGGILGMGENWDDRREMALILEGIDVESVPLNFLVPIQGTPLGGSEPLSADEALRSIALFRLALPDSDIKVIAGRETVLREHQVDIFRAGANGIMIGGYLTTSGFSPEKDRALIRKVSEEWTE